MYTFVYASAEPEDIFTIADRAAKRMRAYTYSHTYFPVYMRCRSISLMM